MPNDTAIPKINALALAEIQEATERYLDDGDEQRWEKSIQRTLTRAHQGAYLLGLAERLGVTLDSPLLNSRNLSRAERNELKSIVSEQLDFLTHFVDQAGNLSEAQILARAQLYALAPKQAYWRGWAGADLDCYPGGCEECYGNCRCSLRREDDGIYWDCADDHASCQSCRDRGQQQPFYVTEEAA